MAAAIAQSLGVPAQSVTVDEGIAIWGKGLAGVILCACSRQRSPRARAELGWSPREDRLDILEECRNPVYALAAERPVASWMKPGLSRGSGGDRSAG